MPNYQGVWSLSEQYQNRTGWPAAPDTQKALFGGGNDGSVTVTIQTIQMDTTGNATDFGDLTVARSSLAACSSLTRGVFGGGGSSNVIDFVQFASAGNATDFGDLTVARVRLAGCSNATRGLFAGGE
jgi:hypothetical protein